MTDKSLSTSKAEGTWYYSKDGRRIGPVRPEAIESLVRKGVIGPYDLLWNTSSDKWVRAKSSDFASLFDQRSAATRASDSADSLARGVKKLILWQGPSFGPNRFTNAIERWFPQPTAGVLRAKGRLNLFALEYSISRLSKTAGFVCLCTIVAMVIQLMDLFGFLTLQQGYTPKAISRNLVSRVEFINAALELLAVLQFVIILLATVSWLKWVYTAHKEIKTQRPNADIPSASKAVISYLLPGVFFWHPYQSMVSLWRWAFDPRGQSSRSDISVVTWWWIVSIVWCLSQSWLVWFAGSAEPTDTKYLAMAVSIIGIQLLFLLTTLLSMSVLKRITAAIADNYAGRNGA